MRRFILLVMIAVYAVPHLSGQIKSGVTKVKTHKIIFQMVSKDTADHTTLMRQIDNIVTLEPKSKLEVVCHGPGISMLMKDKSVVHDKLMVYASKKVDFVACEFTMTQKNISREQLVDVCRTVPGGILEIVYKQEKGWNYIKSGF
ncbi:MAG: DsrE family protein [Saprospiraceae bacterium]|nr:DsrE family protein [Saprospiraceae bacterium]